MNKIKIWNNSLDEQQAHEVAARLGRGELMIYPTDTLYAVACDALNVKAIEKLCRLLGIKPEKACLSIICDNISNAAEYARIPDKAFSLMRQHIPGPYTFIFKASSSLPKAFKSRKQVGVRIPNCQAALAVVKALGHPLLTASVHSEDDDYTVNPELIAENWEGRVDFMLMGEECSTEPSTVIDCTGEEPAVIRHGKGEIEL